MARIEVEESDLESIKAMAQRLQEERDELFGLLDRIDDELNISGNLRASSAIHLKIGEVLDRCTTTPKVME